MQAKNLSKVGTLLYDRNNFIEFKKNVKKCSAGDLKITCNTGGQIMPFPHDLIQAQIIEWTENVIDDIGVQLMLLDVTALDGAEGS